MQKYYSIILKLKLISLIISFLLFFYLFINSDSWTYESNNIYFILDINQSNNIDLYWEYWINISSIELYQEIINNKINNAEEENFGLVLFDKDSNLEIAATNDYDTYLSYINSLQNNIVSIPNEYSNHNWISQSLQDIKYWAKEWDLAILLTIWKEEIDQDIIDSIIERNIKLNIIELSSNNLNNYNINWEYLSSNNSEEIYSFVNNLSPSSSNKENNRYIEFIAAILALFWL